MLFIQSEIQKELIDLNKFKQLLIVSPVYCIPCRVFSLSYCIAILSVNWLRTGPVSGHKPMVASLNCIPLAVQARLVAVTAGNHLDPG